MNSSKILPYRLKNRIVTFLAFIFLICTFMWVAACDQQGEQVQKEKNHFEHAQHAASKVLEASNRSDDPGRAPSQSMDDLARFIPSDPALPKYVGRETCTSCHETQVHDFTNSHHDLAMDLATDETVLADFNDTSFTDPNTGVSTRFFRKDGRYFVNAEGPTGKMQDYEVKYVFGVDPLQQYLIEFPGGHVQCLTICWDVKNKSWYTLYPDEKIPAGDELHWTQPAFNWNYMCASCHSTNMKKNYDEQTLSYQTSWSEIDVSCEACHGPAEKHVAWAQKLSESDLKAYQAEKKTPSQTPTREQMLAEGLKADTRLEADKSFGLLINLKDAGNRTETEVCARCHARRREIQGGYTPGHKFLDYYLVESLQENLYHDDGQILDEVYVYGSFLQSKMYHAGVKCSHCHNPHSLKLLETGNALCTRCHEPSKYDGFQHHHHQPLALEGLAKGDGTKCVDCHMPSKHYMGVDPRRDHSFKVPRPDLSVALGTPNSCNGCHTKDEQDAAWAAKHVEQWFPDSPLRVNEHFATIFHDARKQMSQRVKDLIELSLNLSQPAIIRSTAIHELSRFYPDSQVVDAARKLSRDKEPLVRHRVLSIYDNLAQIPGDLAWVRDVQNLLSDDLRVVRVEAARVMARVATRIYAGADPSGTEQQKKLAKMSKDYESAMAEYQKGLDFLTDRPGAHLNRAVVFEFQGAMSNAEKAYEDALKRQPNFTPALVNLATIYARQGKDDEAEKILKRAIQAQPLVMESYYSLGLLLAGNKDRLGEAAQYLSKAAELAPNDPRVQYNYGLSMQHLNQRGHAERGLKRAVELAPTNLDYLNALVIFYRQANQVPNALIYAEKMLAAAPDDPQLKEALKRQVDMLKQQIRP